MAMDQEQIRGQRLRVSPIEDASLIDYEELYDELFSRQEQGVGAQLHPLDENKGGSGDSR